ncbi:hypothetical protein KGQ20_46270, partial [Catenulispora sp. NF23]
MSKYFGAGDRAGQLDLIARACDHSAWLLSLLLPTGCWLLAAGCWLLAAGCWLLAALVLYQATFARKFSRCGSRRAGQWAGSVGGWSLPGPG